jgi:hypothetical protein
MCLELPVIDAGLLKSIPAVLISSAPVLLHGIDKLMEGVPPLSDKSLREMMEDHDNDILKRLAKSDHDFKDVKSYFDFDRGVHFIISLMIFCMASLYFAQTECSRNFLIATPVTLPALAVVFVFLLCFGFMILNRKLDPAKDHSLRRWMIGAVALFIGVCILELTLRGITTCAAA